MSGKTPHNQQRSAKIGHLWNAIFTVGVLAFGVVALYDVRELWKGWNDNSVNSAFGKCAICHSLEPSDHGIGPSLHCIVGRRIGSLDGYRYSAAMRNKGRGDFENHWDVRLLAGYILNPHGIVPGTRMPFPGIQGEVLPLIEYIQRHCDNDAMFKEHQLLLISTDGRKEFAGCVIEHTTQTWMECEKIRNELAIGDITQPAERPLRLCVPVGRLAC